MDKTPYIEISDFLITKSVSALKILYLSGSIHEYAKLYRMVIKRFKFCSLFIIVFVLFPSTNIEKRL